MHVRLQKHCKMRVVFVLFVWTSVFRLRSVRLKKTKLTSFGYGFIPEFRQARAKQKRSRAMRLGFCQCFASLAPLNTGRIRQNCYWALIDAANRLNWSMQHILLLLFVFLWHIVTNRKSGETSVFIQYVSATKSCCSVRNILTVPIRWMNTVLVQKSGMNSGGICIICG